MQNSFKASTDSNNSGLNSIARNLIRRVNTPDLPNEMSYHVLATMHIVGAITSPTPNAPNSEWFKFFYENGYSTNLFVKAFGEEIGIKDYATKQYLQCRNAELKREFKEIADYCKNLKFPKHDNTLFELISYDTAGNLLYGYGSRLGKCKITIDNVGKYNIRY